MVLLAAVAIPIDLPFFMAFSWFSWVLVGFICLSCQLKEGVAGCCDLLVGTTPFRHNNNRRIAATFISLRFGQIGLLGWLLYCQLLLGRRCCWLRLLVGSLLTRACVSPPRTNTTSPSQVPNLPNQLFLLEIPTELHLFHESTKFSYKLWFFRASFLRGVGFMILSRKHVLDFFISLNCLNQNESKALDI